MELSEWCEQVPHGPYFQPIRLRLDGYVAVDHANDSPLDTPVADPLTAPSTPPREAHDIASGHTNGHSASSPGTTTPKRLKRRQKPSPSTPQTSDPSQPISDVDRDGFVLLPPFQSAYVGASRTVLNVGGPVWAMDWLPHDVYRATTMTATKQHKSNGRANKENVSRNQNGGVAPSETTAGMATSSIKDPLADWRLLALSTHPPCTVVDGQLVKNTPPDHHYNAPQGGRNMVQIWAIPVIKRPSVVVKRENNEQEDEPQATSRLIPRLVYAIDHDSGVAWDVHWSPLTHKMARYRQSRSVLGVLSVAFGDGSVQVFEVPQISSDRLQPEPSEHVVERLQPIALGKMERIIQLSVRWSPHRPNLLLTGCSDGSVALWNLEELLSKTASKDDTAEPYEMEPQRRFQDADTVGKQEPFDWGWGWVAVRAVCWSPFDENLFATTGNDSLFKIWDMREPRICFRSHRIRSTWGLAIQWMDDTSIQISGDQGSLYMYDVLSGSYQKLHFHPQIDSPVWDLQFARTGRLPILLSSCTSGSLRVAPAKKIFRAPQHSVEFCRLHGEKNSNVELPHKSLTISFEHRIVSGSAEAASPATREFCERDASLHRVRLSTTQSGEFPCFLAAGGHAGLVILMEMQEDFDNLFENYFLQPSKKIGRPRKSGANAGPWYGRSLSQDKPKKLVAPPKIKRVGGVKLSSFAHTNGSGVKSKQKSKKVAKDAEYPELQMESASPSEEEYQDGESESESEELSLGDDNSDDDRVIGSDDEESDNVELVESTDNSNVARMRQEYQMDLSEEDAILLAIQMSQLEQTAPGSKSTKSTEELGADGRVTKLAQSANLAKKTKRLPSNSTEDEATPAEKKRKPPSAKKSKANSSNNRKHEAMLSTTSKKPDAVQPTTKKSAQQSNEKDARNRKVGGKAVATTPSPSKGHTPAQPDILYVDEVDQSSIQMHIYQQGMTEEDALREALRMSEMGLMRRSNRKRKSPLPPSTVSTDSAAARPTPPSQKRSRSRPVASDSLGETAPSVGIVNPALSPDEVARRLEFATTSPPLAPASHVSALTTPPVMPKSPAKPGSSGKMKAAPKKASPKDPSGEAVDGSTPAKANAAFSTPKQPTRKPAGKTGSATKSSKKTPPSASSKSPKAKRASGAGGLDFLTEEELLAIALQTSQIEY